MSTKELSYVESSSETELLADSNSSQPDDEIGIKEWCQIRCKPSFQMRRVKNKGAILILIWSYLISSVYTIGWHYIGSQNYINHTLVYMLIFLPMGFTVVLAAMLADFRFGRYKVISFSLWIVWTCSILLTLTAIIKDFTHIGLTVQVLTTLLLVFLGIGWGGYQANVIQFGIDQLIDASATECKSFIIWLCWSYFASQVAVTYVIQCFDHNIYPFLIMSCNVTIALVLKLIFNHHLIKEPTTQNPFKLIYQVIKYAIKHKQPRLRSAFTYCEDNIPSRIDFGKSKYGGPFTTEQVEDIKTLLRSIIFMLLISVVVCSCLDADGYLPLFIYDMFVSHLRECSYEFTTINFGQISVTVLVPLYELVIHPIFHRLIPNVKIPYKACIGALLHLSRLVLLLTLVTYARHFFINSETSGNSTLQCVFHEPPGSLETGLDNRWKFLSGFLGYIGDAMYLISIIEYLCAQVPYSMKGIVAGLFFACVGLFLPIFSSVYFVFETTHFTWGTGLISCGFWYFVTKICLLLATMIIFIISILKCYKKRKREDVLPNEHIFAERYYSS